MAKYGLWCLWPCLADRWGDAEILSSLAVPQHIVHWVGRLNMHWCRAARCPVCFYHGEINTRGHLANHAMTTCAEHNVYKREKAEE